MSPDDRNVSDPPCLALVGRSVWVALPTCDCRSLPPLPPELEPLSLEPQPAATSAAESSATGRTRRPGSGMRVRWDGECIDRSSWIAGLWDKSGGQSPNVPSGKADEVLRA